MRVLPALLLAVSLAVPVVLADGDHGGRPTTTTPTSDGRDGGGSHEDGGHQPAATGAFHLSTTSQSVTGQFVSFSYTDNSITGYSYAGLGTLFDASISGTSGDHGGRSGVQSEGAQVRLRTASYSLQVHDNPEAVTQLQTSGTVTVTFASGVSIGLADNGSSATFTLGNLTGSVHGKDLALSGNVLSVRDELLLLTNAPHGTFDTHRGDINEAIGQNHVGAEGSFNRANGSTQQDVVNFGNVTMTTVKADEGNLTVQVEGHGFDGRVLVLNVDKALVHAGQASDLVVKFDNETISPAANLTDALDPDAHGLHAVYYVVFDPQQDAFQLIVSVPHYSVHTLSVGTLVELVQPSVVIGVVAGVVLLAPTAMLLFRRSK